MKNPENIIDEKKIKQVKVLVKVWHFTDHLCSTHGYWDMTVKDSPNTWKNFEKSDHTFFGHIPIFKTYARV